MSVGEVKADLAIRFMKNLPRATKLCMVFAVGAMAEKAKAYCAQTIGLTDHTLLELAKMKHPYAKRWGPQGAGLHSPWQGVHVQSGDLLRGLKTTPPSGNAQGAQAAVINEDPKDVDIQTGTPTMIARPYMNYVKATFAAEILAAGRAELERRLGKSEEVRSA